MLLQRQGEQASSGASGTIAGPRIKPEGDGQGAETTVQCGSVQIFGEADLLSQFAVPDLIRDLARTLQRCGCCKLGPRLRAWEAKGSEESMLPIHETRRTPTKAANTQKGRRKGAL